MREFKKILFLFVAIILFITPMQVQAASQKDVKQIKAQTVGLIRACKKYDRNKAMKYIDMNTNKGKFYYNTVKDWNTYIKQIKKRDKYKITEIKVKGKEATVYLDYTTVDLYGVVSGCFTEELHKKGKFNSEQFQKKVTKEIKYCLKHRKELKEIYELKLKLKKVKGKWIVSKINYDVRFMYDSGVADCLKDFIDNPFNFI